MAESGQCEKAIPLLKKEILQVTDDNLRRATGLAGVRCTMMLGQTDAAVDFIRLLSRQFPEDPEVLYLAVHIYSDLSLKASRELLFKAPASYQVRLLNAEALEVQERWSEAADEYRAVLLKEPNLPGIHYRLGRLLLSLPQQMVSPATREEARHEFEAELKVNPSNAGAEYVLGEMARQSNDWQQAADHFRKASELDPTLADAFIGLGRSLIATRKLAEAVIPLEQAAKMQPDNPAAHYHLAMVYSRLGQTAKAENETAIFRKTSERANQMKQDMQTSIIGPQKAEP